MKLQLKAKLNQAQKYGQYVALSALAIGMSEYANAASYDTSPLKKALNFLIDILVQFKTFIYIATGFVFIITVLLGLWSYLQGDERVSGIVKKMVLPLLCLVLLSVFVKLGLGDYADKTSL